MFEGTEDGIDLAVGGLEAGQGVLASRGIDFERTIESRHNIPGGEVLVFELVAAVRTSRCLYHVCLAKCLKDFLQVVTRDLLLLREDLNRDRFFRMGESKSGSEAVVGFFAEFHN